jgi:phenylpropionate dioxygenase-like ring-hydroxylating dioxygenase large terminal subunit
MSDSATIDVASLVRPDRAHRRVYTDPAVFALEMERIFGRVWIYVAHDSQLRNPGDQVRSRLGLADVVVARTLDGEIAVVRNRCAHRGMPVCPKETDHGRRFVCPYHGWAYELDGRLIGVPDIRGYGGRIKPGDPAFSLPRVPRVAGYRGFIFASLAEDGPSLAEYLGEITVAIDNLVDRAPDREIEIAGGRLRQEYRANWKLHMENACDLVHPGYVHASSVASARAHSAETGEAVETSPQAIQMFHANGATFEQWDSAGVFGYPNGHCYMGSFYRPGALDPAKMTPSHRDYVARLIAVHGEARTQAILGRETFNNLIYPNISINTRFQQFRVIQPIAVDRTQVHSYCFRLKGAPEEMFRASVRFVSTNNSASSPISSDDFAIFEDTQRGLSDGTMEWVDFSRGAGTERPFGNTGVAAPGTHELPMRTLMAAWARYMGATA